MDWGRGQPPAGSLRVLSGGRGHPGWGVGVTARERQTRPGTQELGAGGAWLRRNWRVHPLIGWPRFPIASVRLRRLWGVQRVCNAWGPGSLLGALHVLNLRETQWVCETGRESHQLWLVDQVQGAALLGGAILAVTQSPAGMGQGDWGQGLSPRVQGSVLGVGSALQLFSSPGTHWFAPSFQRGVLLGVSHSTFNSLGDWNAGEGAACLRGLGWMGGLQAHLPRWTRALSSMQVCSPEGGPLPANHWDQNGPAQRQQQLQPSQPQGSLPAPCQRCQPRRALPDPGQPFQPQRPLPGQRSWPQRSLLGPRQPSQPRRSLLGPGQPCRPQQLLPAPDQPCRPQRSLPAQPRQPRWALLAPRQRCRRLRSLLAPWQRCRPLRSLLAPCHLCRPLRSILAPWHRCRPLRSVLAPCHLCRSLLALWHRCWPTRSWMGPCLRGQPSRASSGQRCRPPQSLLVLRPRRRPASSLSGQCCCPRRLSLAPCQPRRSLLGQPSRPRRSLLGLSQPQQLVETPEQPGPPKPSLLGPGQPCQQKRPLMDPEQPHPPKRPLLGPEQPCRRKRPLLGPKQPCQPLRSLLGPSQPCQPQPLLPIPERPSLLGRPTPPRRPLLGPPSQPRQSLLDLVRAHQPQLSLLAPGQPCRPLRSRRTRSSTPAVARQAPSVSPGA